MSYRPTRRATFGLPVLALPLSAGAVPATGFTPEMFGARGDGVTDDTLAFSRLSEAVNGQSGGVVNLRRTVYLVGQQTLQSGTTGDWSYRPAPLLEFRKCTQRLQIIGNGARLILASGLRFGTFSRTTGLATTNKLPFYDRTAMASPCAAMLWVEDCSGGIEISDLELDGNIGKTVIGGPFGDTGRQIPATGLLLSNNRGSEIVRNVFSHHHGTDGVMIDGLDAAPSKLVKREFTKVRATDNGRQGCSLVGGRGYSFAGCTFERSGRGPVSSAPGAGFDIEAEGGKVISDIRFSDCLFSDNTGCGMVADSGPSSHVSFTRCTFIGTTSVAAWPSKPFYRFDHCRFVGATVRTFADDTPGAATQFSDCLFTDSPALSPTGVVFLVHPIIDTGGGKNVRFTRCAFKLVGRGRLPWSTESIYVDCSFSQRTDVMSYPRGVFRGTNVIVGHVDTNGSKNFGSLKINGKAVAVSPGR
ncbi:right-handed parallel beta-helix repeat-containing protein [Sphingomonas sp.]|uniref:right-handed parallel beta-helix repeat-containing protein n=1 Tax=Sphingomonas sp. TaxID=28214 RepID=UPI0025F29665|nr:right-handed parallel beta-helix repeat-containing protein [Sphingomonas sp.]